MKALQFWKTVVDDRSDFLDRLIDLLDRNGIRYCVIGGQAVNAYAEPLVSLDLDLAIAVDELERAESLLAGQFQVERFPFSINVSAPGSNLRVQLQTDPRYGGFPARAAIRDVLGLPVPVASPEDAIQGKVWAASDKSGRPSKRTKNLLDIVRLLEVRPDLVSLVPQNILDRLPR